MSGIYLWCRKSWKKPFSLMLLFFMLFSILPLNIVKAEDNDKVTLSVGSASGEVGETVEIAVSIAGLSNLAGLEGLSGGQFELVYDASIADVASDTDIRQGELIDLSQGEWIRTRNHKFTENSLFYVFASTGTELISGDGALIKVTFTLLQAGEVNLQLRDVILKDDQEIPADIPAQSLQLENGNITVNAPPLEAPFIVPAGQTFNAPQSITIEAPAGTDIYYESVKGPRVTLDDVDDPTASSTSYTDPIPIALGERLALKAIYYDGDNNPSELAERVFEVLAAPVAAPAPAAEPFGEAQQVTLSVQNADTVIYYTTDGSTPSAQSQQFIDSFTVSVNRLVKAIAVKEGVSSEVATFEYIIRTQTPTVTTVWEEQTSISGTTEPDAQITVERDSVLIATGQAGSDGEYVVSLDPEITLLEGDELTIVAQAPGKAASLPISITVLAIDECFIATAAFGSKLEPAVVLLRQFRDRYMLTNAPGSAFVRSYYSISPPVAALISGNAILKSLVQLVLLPFIGLAFLAMNKVLTLLLVIVLTAGCFIFARLRRRKGKAEIPVAN